MTTGYVNLNLPSSGKVEPIDSASKVNGILSLLSQSV
jgi:hypothetical protein